MLLSQLNCSACSRAASRIAARSPSQHGEDIARHRFGIADRPQPARRIGHPIDHRPAATPTTGRPDACASMIEIPKVSSAMPEA